jgi:6-phosphogluconolactonase (cycloisomerase 2 family)
LAVALLATAAMAAPIGSLRFADFARDGEGGVDGLEQTDDVALSADGDFLYVTSSPDDTVSVFSRSRRQKLHLIQVRTDNVGNVTDMTGTEDVAISPDGRFVYVTAVDDNSLVVFKRNRRSGKLKFDDSFADGTGPFEVLESLDSVTVSPDSKFVYVSSQEDSAITILKRTRQGHRFVDDVRDGQGDTVLPRPWGIDITDNGKNAYVASQTLAATPGAVVAFKRKPRTGRLRFLQAIDGDEQPTVDDAFMADASPDGRNVYVGSADTNAVSVFKRNRHSGRIRFVQAKRDGVGGIEFLEAPFDVVVTPDGKTVYSSAYEDDAIVAFKRKPRSGKLALISEEVDGQGSNDGLEGTWRVAADNRGVFGAGYGESAVSAFRRIR